MNSNDIFHCNITYFFFKIYKRNPVQFNVCLINKTNISIAVIKKYYILAKTMC